jgi:hypothetical protein
MPSCWEMSQDMWSRNKYNCSPCNGDMIFHKTYKEKSVQFTIFEHYKLYSHLHFNWIGAFVVMIVWYLDLQLPMQSMPITTKAVSWNPVHGMVYSMQHYLIKFVSDFQQFGGFLWVLRFPPPIKLTTTI